jgi:hypothetical protein
MANATFNARSDALLTARDAIATPETAASAVSWSAIIAGAVVAAALSLSALGSASYRSRRGRTITSQA